MGSCQGLTLLPVDSLPRVSIFNPASQLHRPEVACLSFYIIAFLRVPSNFPLSVVN